MEITREPFHGATHTVEVIVKAAVSSQEHFEVRQLAEKICQEVRSKDYLSEALAIYHFVDANTRYMKDPRTVELVRAPYVVVRQLAAGQRPCLDCDDLTALLVALLMAVGARCRVVTVAFAHQFYNKERQYSHVFCQFFEPKSGKWLTLDPVARERTANMHARVVAMRTYPVG